MEENKKPRRRKSFLIKIIIAVIFVAVLALAYFISHNAKKKQAPHDAPLPVVVKPVTHMDVPITLEGLGTVQAFNTVTVHSQIDGQLWQVLFTEGQEVKKGDLLAKIDPRTLQAAVGQAVGNKAKDAATLANDQADLVRYQQLGDDISKQTTDTQVALVKQLQATVAVDQAAIDNAKAQLTYTDIRSPIDGKTGIRQVDVGNIIHAADANGLVVITQLKPISVIFSLPQQNIMEINQQLSKLGTLKVMAYSNDNKNMLDTGELVLVDNQIDQTTGTVKLKSTFPNLDNRLWPGGFVNVSLLLDVQKNAMVIPTVAIQRGPNNSYVFALQSDNTVGIKAVDTGAQAGDFTVISKGLTDNDKVVTDGMAKLQDKSKVIISGADNKKSGQPGTEQHHHKKDTQDKK